MKHPAIIDQEIAFTVYTHSLLSTPMAVEEYDPNDSAETRYAMAMNHITEGKIDQGRKDLETAYQLGSWRAGNALAYGLSAGWFGERDYHAHLVILRDLVAQGSRDAMNNLGFAYDHGLGLRKSTRWAMYWYEKAAEKGSMEAMSNLAILYLFREIRYNNIDRGVFMAFKGADLGCATAMNTLGVCYENGFGVPISEEKSFEWTSKAVENGAGPCAQHNLARCYRKGIGTQIDKTKAEEWERIAAENGYMAEREMYLWDLREHKDKVRAYIKECYPNYTEKDLDDLMEGPVELWEQKMSDFDYGLLARNLSSGLI